ncbi:hypothetical protein Pint_29231 [Pistacia integerrima]|uniref:Uncharacterized protein n=1 Tax=Pistacia integerrima TaxID=434235 RepID=A0ACC0X4R0_9ROSI|nr:hypothetical protein Pint_29231 [Pistacia integerrima]
MSRENQTRNSRLQNLWQWKYPIFLLKEKLRSLAKGSQIIQPMEGAQLRRSIKKLSEVEELLKSDSSNGSFIPIQKEKPTAYVHLNLPYRQSCFLKNLEKLVGKISNLSKTSTSNTEDRMEELLKLILNGDRSHFHIPVVEYGSKREPLQKIYNDERQALYVAVSVDHLLLANNETPAKSFRLFPGFKLIAQHCYRGFENSETLLFHQGEMEVEWRPFLASWTRKISPSENYFA